MTTATLDGHVFHVNEEGFLTIPEEWNEELAPALATQIGITLTDQHWEVLRFLRADFAETGETATLRRVSTRPASRSSSCSPCSRRSRPRRWPTSRVSPSRTAASDHPPTPAVPGETRHDHHRTSAPRPSYPTSTTPRARAASSRSSAPRATSTWPTRP